MDTESLTTKSAVRVSITIRRMNTVKDNAAAKKISAVKNAIKVAYDLAEVLVEELPAPQDKIKAAIGSLQRFKEEIDKAHAMQQIAVEALYELEK